MSSFEIYDGDVMIKVNIPPSDLKRGKMLLQMVLDTLDNAIALEEELRKRGEQE